MDDTKEYIVKFTGAEGNYYSWVVSADSLDKAKEMVQSKILTMEQSGQYVDEYEIVDTKANS